MKDPPLPKPSSSASPVGSPPSLPLRALERKRPRKLVIEALEPRILFSGSPAPAPEPATAPDPAPAQVATAESAPEPAATPAPEDTAVAAPPQSFGESGDQPVTGAPAAAVENQGVTAIALTDSEVQAVAEAAAQRWIESGISDAQIAALASATYQIADLDANLIGAAEGNVITLDIDAAGRGWFVDSTPLADEEFSPNGVTLEAADQNASSRIDLLTAILHDRATFWASAILLPPVISC